MIEINWKVIHLLDRTDLECAGFKKWDDSGLMLIPHRLFNKIPLGTVLTKIDGSTFKFTKKASRDQRFGFLAYGVLRSE
jgi:hypothetical protein